MLKKDLGKAQVYEKEREQFNYFAIKKTDSHKFKN